MYTNIDVGLIVLIVVTDPSLNLSSPLIYDCHDDCPNLIDIHRQAYDLLDLLDHHSDELIALRYEVHERHDDRYE